MINYKIAIHKKLIHHNDSHLKLHLRYFQYLLHRRIEQAKRKYFENTSHKLSNKNLNPKKYWALLKIILNGKKYLAYLQIITMINLYPILKTNVISLIHILQNSAQLS